jgi:hypothetical protein
LTGWIRPQSNKVEPDAGAIAFPGNVPRAGGGGHDGRVMNPWQIEQVRLSLLRYLAEAAPYALGEPLLLQCLKCEGWAEAGAALARELEYLQDKGLVETAPKMISPENRAWRVTAAGRDYAAGARRRLI